MAFTYTTTNAVEAREGHVAKDGNRHYVTVPKEWRGRPVTVILHEEKA